MAKYRKSALTAAGLALANRAAKGQATFKITRATSTAETIEDTAIAGLVKLPNEVQVGAIMGDQPLSDGDGTITGTKVLFTNHNLHTSYQVRAIGLYAVESDGDEFLYAVVTAIEPEFMPDFSDQVLMEFGMTIYVVVGQVDNMSIIVNPDSLATVAYVDKAIADHQVVFPETLTYSNRNEVITSKWTFKGGVVDSEGTQLATVKDVSTGDTANLEAAKAYADTQASDKISKNGRYGAENLVRNSAYMQNYNGWTAFGNGAVDDTKFSIFVTPHKFYHSDKDNLIQIVNLNTFTSGNASEVYLMSNSFSVTAGKTMAYSFLGFASANVVHEDVYFIGYKADGTQVPMLLQQSINLSYNNLDGRSGTFTVPDDIITGQIRFDNNGSTNGKSAGLFITEVKVAEESVVSPWSPSRLDSVKDNGDDTVTINGKSYVPANAANVVHRSPDTGRATDATDFPYKDLTVDGYPVIPFVLVPDRKTALAKTAQYPNYAFMYGKELN